MTSSLNAHERASARPGQPCYRILLYAPGLLTGYGAKTMPGVREAIGSGDWTEAWTYIGRTAEALNTVADRIDLAARALAQ